MPFCPNCGNEIPENTIYCPRCGRPVNEQYTATFVSRTSIKFIYSKASELLFKKPVKLWGLSLMASLLTVLAIIFGFIPLISLPLVFGIEVGMAAIYLDGYHGKEVNSDQLFTAFKKGSFFRFAGGMAWMYLWILIWGLIPIAGIVFSIIKAYSYRFVPYILLADPNISATEALRVSMRMTDGYKGRMFFADLLVFICAFFAALILSMLSLIKYIGLLFSLALIILYILYAALSPLFFGIIKAAFFDEIKKENMGNQQ